MATDPNMLGLTASAFLIFGAVNLLGRLKEMRRISQESLMRDFRNGFIVGMAVSATGGVIDLLINSITQDMFKHSTGKAVVMRGLFNYLLPRFFPLWFY